MVEDTDSEDDEGSDDGSMEDHERFSDVGSFDSGESGQESSPEGQDAAPGRGPDVGAPRV